jgi:transcriptional regulator with XRE-family HTH domain
MIFSKFSQKISGGIEMSFYECYEALCFEHGMKPQAQEILNILGVTSPTISGWKKGSSPKIEVLCRLARYFNVTTDYLLGLSDTRNLAEEEQLLLEAYRNASVEGRFNIVQVCMNEREKVKL